MVSLDMRNMLEWNGVWKSRNNIANDVIRVKSGSFDTKRLYVIVFVNDIEGGM